MLRVPQVRFITWVLGSSIAPTESLQIAAILTHPRTIPVQPICLFNEVTAGKKPNVSRACSLNHPCAALCYRRLDIRLSKFPALKQQRLSQNLCQRI